jgi:DNA-binding response OmpR family regulator
MRIALCHRIEQGGQVMQERILCVEDHLDTSELLKYALGLLGYEIVCTYTYNQTLSKISDEDFDAYILDNWLPGGRGVDLCRLIRQRDLETPIIFYSADSLDSVIQEARNAGANEYFVKPANLSELELTVVRLILEANSTRMNHLSPTFFNKLHRSRRLPINIDEK